MSQACSERVLFPAVRGSAAEDLVVAPGFSCRHKIADFCDHRGSLHTAELLGMAEQARSSRASATWAAVVCRSEFGYVFFGKKHTL